MIGKSTKWFLLFVVVLFSNSAVYCKFRFIARTLYFIVFEIFDNFLLINNVHRRRVIVRRVPDIIFHTFPLLFQVIFIEQY